MDSFAQELTIVGIRVFLAHCSRRNQRREMIDPIILFFLMGVIAGVMRSELRLPSQVYDILSIVLLIAIGLKGGVELAKQNLTELIPAVVAITSLGFLLPLIAYPVLLRIGRFSQADSASIAAHYGSVSVGTFAVAVSFLNAKGIAFEEYMPLFVVLLEMPAIFIGILLAKGIEAGTDWGEVCHEIFLGKGVVLLMGGLLIGWVSGSEGIEPLKPLFFDQFKGVLALFLLEMGLVASSHIRILKRYGLFILGFGILMPLMSSLLGILVGVFLNLSLGGVVLVATLSASASYIAVPAAMRISVPEANPTLSLTASLGITFPFNVLAGIPLYLFLSKTIIEYLGGA